MRRICALLVASLVLCSPTGALQKPPVPKQQPTPVPADWYPGRFCGTVLGVGADGLVIKPTGWLKMLVLDHKLDGTLRERFYLQDNSKPAREFKFCAAPRAVQCGDHDVTNVQTGDFVAITCHRFNGTEFCNSVQIQRRWGGTVPMAAGDDTLEAKNRSSTRWNNEQRNEERAYAIAGRVLRNLGR
jgi:hypothetical protein